MGVGLGVHWFVDSFGESFELQVGVLSGLEDEEEGTDVAGGSAVEGPGWVWSADGLEG